MSRHNFSSFLIQQLDNSLPPHDSSLRESAELCCKQHFGNVNLATCVANSKADVAAEEAKVAADLARQKYFYPDMFGKQNCVYASDYDDWMMGDVRDLSLSLLTGCSCRSSSQ